MRTATAGFVALGLILSACAAGAAETTTTATTTTTTPTTTSSSTTTTTVPPTTTTTVDDRELSLINGLPVEDPLQLERRVLAVKIDNHPRANPQSGIDKADMVIEVLVEGICLETSCLCGPRGCVFSQKTFEQINQLAAFEGLGKKR